MLIRQNFENSFILENANSLKEFMAGKFDRFKTENLTFI